MSPSPLSSRDRPWYPGQPLPPQERPSRALLEASLAAAAKAGVSAPLPAGMMGAEEDADGEESETQTRGGGAATTEAAPRTEAATPAPLSCAGAAAAAAEADDDGGYPLTPVDDDARSALVDDILRACEPGDPVLASICRLLRSVLGVPMTSVTLISHKQAWFRGGESANEGASSGGAGGGSGASCSAAAAAAAPNSKSNSTSDPDPMPRGRVLCAYSLIGEPDVSRERLFFFWGGGFLSSLSLSLPHSSRASPRT